MGTDKAVLVVDGERLVDRCVTVLGSVCDEVLVASGDGRRLGALPQVADAVADIGPLGGVLAALRRAPTPLVAVLGVDHPHASAAVFRELLDRHDGEVAVVAPRVDGRLQPLHAVWSSALVPALERFVADGGRSVMSFLATVEVLVVDAVDLPGDGAFAVNVNRPRDLPGRPRG